MAVTSLVAEQATFCIVQGVKVVCPWETPSLADAVEDRVLEFPFVILQEVSAQGVHDSILEAWLIDC